MQGVLPDASAFLVSGLASRQWYSEAVMLERCEPGARAGDSHEPGGRLQATLPPKAREALCFLAAQTRRHLPPDARICLRSNIPRGKGLSSSSADILSVLSLANIYLGTGLSSAELYQIAARVEPTDPCFSEDILVFHQHSGRPGAIIEMPPVTLMYFDAAPECQVDTLGMRRRWTDGEGKFFAWLLQRLIRAARAGDYELIFDTITYSAEYNQTVLTTPGFEDYYRLATEAGAGLMVAHSGTIAGLLVRPEQESELRPMLEAVVSRRRQTGGTSGEEIFTEHYFSPYHPDLCRTFPAR